MNNDYYVYEHFVRMGTIHVGIGQGTDAWNPDLHNHAGWLLDCIHSNRVYVRMWVTKSTKEDCESSIVGLKKNLVWAKPEYTPKDKKLSHKKGVYTPEGFFKNLVEAGKHYLMHPSTIAGRCESEQEPNWRRVK